jgi:penicillin-binding protein 1C
MDMVTGSTGPALVLHEVFAQLRTDTPYAGLWRSPRLAGFAACEWIGNGPCIQRPDWRLPGRRASVESQGRFAFARPLPGEILAIDPRLASAAQRYRFVMATANARVVKIEWRLDGRALAVTRATTEDWRLVPGKHELSARIWLATQKQPLSVGRVHFSVLASGTTAGRDKVDVDTSANK